MYNDRKLEKEVKMAQRRMFSKTITNSSNFLMMPPTAQLLYYHLGMNADDDGFCEHFAIMRMTESKPDDLKILAAKGYVQVFDDKVLVIIDWAENNYIPKDRYKSSKYLNIYKKELSRLENYKRKLLNLDTECIQDVYKMDTQVRLGKDSKDKDIKKENKQRKEVAIYQVNNFEMLWNRYPIKKGKLKAQEAFLKLKPNDELLEVMLTAIEDQKLERTALANSGNFVPEWIYLQGWINQKRYLDVVKTTEETENAESSRSSQKHLRKSSVDSTIEFCNELREANRQLREYVTNNVEIIDNIDEIHKH